MKKALIAGAASAVLAAMPVVGVFAVGTGETLTDKLELKIEDTCQMEIPTGGHTANTTQIAGGSWDDSTSTYTGTVVNNHLYTEFATTGLKVTCNSAGGYQVKVAATDFEDKNSQVSTDTYGWTYVKGSAGTAATLSSTDSQWTLSSTGENADLANDFIAKRTSALEETGTTITVKYSAFVDATQPTATYDASATYLFTKL